MKKLVMLPLSALAGISMLFGPRAALSAEVPADDKTAVVYFRLQKTRGTQIPQTVLLVHRLRPETAMSAQLPLWRVLQLSP